MFQDPSMSLAVLLSAVVTTHAFAHGGRRFEVQVAEGKLQAQGYNTIDTPMDPAGPRPYLNAIHDHFHNVGGVAASATLPGFDVFDASPFTVDDLTLTLVGSMKWSNVSSSLNAMGHVLPGTTPTFTSLDAGEVIYVTDEEGTTLDTDTLGALSLALEEDVDMSYDVAFVPSDSLYVLAFELSASGLETSNTVHVILSPDGANAVEKLHHASLFTEQWLGTPVPEPASIGVLAMSAMWMLRRRRA